MEQVEQVGRCVALWFMTLAVCFLNMIYSMSVISIVTVRNNFSKGIGWFMFAVSGFWNLVYLLRSLCCRPIENKQLKKSSFGSCLSVMVALTCTFTFATRYYYFERFPKYPEERDGLFTGILIHKMGLILLVFGIPVIYGCEFKQMKNDKMMIRKVIVDFIDIYEMAEILDLGAPSCTRLHSNNGYNNTMNSYNNTMNSYNNTMNSYNNTMNSYNNTMNSYNDTMNSYNNTMNSYNDTMNSYNNMMNSYNDTMNSYGKNPLFNCTESPFSALTEGSSIEIAVQVLCSFSFLLFAVIYVEALKESENIKDSSKKYKNIARLLQDIPFFIIRTWVWILYGFQTDQFIFLVKNVLSGSLISLGLCETCILPDESNKNPGPSNASQQRNAMPMRSQTNTGFDNNAI